MTTRSVTMTTKRFAGILLLALGLSAAIGLSPFNPVTAPKQTASPADDTAAGAEPAAVGRSLVGSWKLIRASVTPDFLNAPIPINSFDALGSIREDSTYTIEASGSFFGSRYGYLGRGDIDLDDGSMMLTIDEGVITVDDKKKKRDRKGRKISGTYRVTAGDTLHVEAVKEQDGIRFTFNLELVDS